jgi:uncharacterized protein YecT (DUF1311 family)
MVYFSVPLLVANLNKPKMASADATLKQAYMELAKADRSGDYERALKAANRSLLSFRQK